ncbi:hypothetical protein GGR52DRAFT_166393 [Hypoxylon sp. FL1284]|nr:hypothetical protein GGR52DRAFT_166393 [Hypoxylon sp. FL1284]
MALGFRSCLWTFCLIILFEELYSVNAVENWPITAPVAGEVVPVGQRYEIRWNNDTNGPVSITLNYDEQPVVITSSTENTGTFTWISASVFAGDNDYYLSICDLASDPSECSVTSDGRFHISSFSASSTASHTSTPTSTGILAEFHRQLWARHRRYRWDHHGNCISALGIGRSRLLDI